MVGLDECYFLGVICARGSFQYLDNKISISLPYKKAKLAGLSGDHDHEARLLLGLSDIANRFSRRLGTSYDLIKGKNVHTLCVHLPTTTLSWDTLYTPFEGQESYHSMQVPNMFFDTIATTDDQVREFIKGYSDIAGTIRKSNNDQIGRHRVYIDVLNNVGNWSVPSQLCWLLQQRLSVAVREIMYGHPNLNRKFREHQIRVDATTFAENIGFNFSHKQAVLLELADENRKMGLPSIGLCPGLAGKRKTFKKKPKHPDENDSERLPAELVGKHFNRYPEICRKCGCKQDTKTKVIGRPKLR
jgi:hypothetical protein